jgi:hypothetical protein
MPQRYRPGRRRFLQQAAALVGAVPVVSSMEPSNMAQAGRASQAAGGRSRGPVLRMATGLSQAGVAWVRRAPGSGFPEAWAARELARGLRNLGFAHDPCQATLGAGEPGTKDAVFTLLVDRDAFTHPEACEIALERAGGPSPRVRITGATPRAVLHGVFAFLERQGVFFGLDGEVYPLDPPRNLVLPEPRQAWMEQPRFDVRGLVPWPDFLNCITVFNREDHRAYLEAMVRMRFNTLGIHVYGQQNQWAESFLSFEYGGVGHLAFTDTTATNRWGYLPQRTSRYGMGAADFYENEVFGSEATTLARGPWEAAERARALWADAFRYAARLGIRTGVGFEPYQVPDEILRAVPPEARLEQEDPKVPLPRVDPESVAARDILEARLGQLLEAYPDIDDVWLWEDEGMSWASQQKKVPLPMTSFFQAHRFLQRHAPRKRLVISGWGGVTRHFADFHQRLPGDIIFSSLSDQLGWDPVSEEYGRLEKRDRWPILWIEDDPAMWLPQFHVHRFARDLDRAESFGCQGLLGIHWRHRILSATAGFQSRRSWRKDLEPSQFYRQLARASVRVPRVEPLARTLDECDRERQLLCSFTGQIKDGHHQIHEYSGDYNEAFQFWNGYEPASEVKASQAMVARALRELSDAAASPLERERLEYLTRHIEFLVPYADSWSLAWRLQQLLTKARDLKRQGDAAQARTLVSSEGVPVWLELAPLVRAAILHFQAIASTRSDLGTLASMHNKYERLALVRLRASMKEFLGELPPQVEAVFEQVRRPDPGAAPRVIVPTRPTAIGPGERVRVTAIVLGGARVDRVSIVTRVGSKTAWRTAPMEERGRRTYEAHLAGSDTAGTLLDYYVAAEIVMAGQATRCTAPLEAPDHVYAVTLLP